MKKLLILIILSMMLPGFIYAPGVMAQTEDEAVVHAVLFFSPTCPHCHDVINNLLVPMIEEHGERLQILAVDVTQDDGQLMYQTAIEHYQIPPNRLGVPTLIVNEQVLVGSGEIPDQFPQIVATGLAGSGIGWPGIPGLAESLAAQAAAKSQPQEAPAAEAAAPEAPTAETGENTSTGNNAAAKPAPEKTAAEAATSADSSAPATEAPTAAQPESAVIALDENNVPEIAGAEIVPPDPIAIGLAGLVLGGMLFALFFAARALSLNAKRLFELSRVAADSARSWLIPALALAGLAVSGYLAYVEITHTEAVCGPVGNCNAVQSSPYAAIAGVPVAVLGLLNYVAVIALWLGIRFGRGQVADLSLLGLLTLGLVGVIFSVYLTALEIFVIQAVCIWCITSAIITTAILLIAAASIRMPATRRAVPT